MTPANKPAPSEAKPAQPPADVKVDGQADAKADVKVATPPKDEKKPEEKPADANPDAAPSVIDFKDWSAYSLVLGGGYGWRDMGNDQGLDHGGGIFRAGAGLNFRFGERFKLTPRIFFQHQGLHKDLGEGITSDASINSVGVETLGTFAVVPQWFSVGGLIGLGASIYSSPDTTDGLNGGVEFNKNALKFPLSGAAFRFEAGLNLGIWNDAFNIYGKYVLDSGLNPKLEVVDGNYPPMGLSPSGPEIGLNVDLLAIGDNIWGKKTKARKAAEEAPKANPNDKTPGDPAKPGTVKPGTPEKPPTAVKLTGVPLFEQRAKEIKDLAAKAKGYADSAKQNNTDLKAEKDAAKSKALAIDARQSLRLAVEQVNAADAYVAELELEVEKLEGEDKKKAAAILKEAKKDADAANESARKAWDEASAAVKKYNTGKGTADQVDFPDPKPEVRGRPVAKPGGGTGKKPDDKKPDQKKPDDKKPDDKKPDDKKPDQKKPDDKKPGGGVIDFGDGQ